MTRILTPLFLILFPLSFLAQSTNEVTWEWSNTYGNQANSVANKVIVDDNLDLYVCGTYDDTLVVDGQTIISPGSEVVFLAKFDQFGDLIWIRSVFNAVLTQTMLLDAEDNIRLLTDNQNILVFSGLNGDPIEMQPLPSALPNGIERSIDMEVDSDINTYVLSTEEDNTTWDFYCKITKYDSSYNLLWTRSFTIGMAGSNGGVYGISKDSVDNIYVSGTADFGYAVTLAGTTISGGPGGSGFGSLFLAKYTPSGDALWLDTQDVMFIEQLGMEVNTTDNSMYLTGYQIVDEIFYGDTLTMDTTNQQQIYLMKYDLDGNYQWAKAFPLATKSQKTIPNGSWGATGSHLSITNSGNVYLKGSFTGSIIFNQDTLVEDTTTVVLNTIADDVFIAKLDAIGNPVWGKYAGNSGGIGNETGGFWVDAVNDIIYMVGYYAAPNNLIKMLPGYQKSVNDPTKSVFVGKEGDPFAGVSEISLEEHRLLVYPNPSRGLYTISKSDKTGDSRYCVLDLRGNILLSGELIQNTEQIDLTEFSSGMYILQTEYGSTKLLKE